MNTNDYTTFPSGGKKHNMGKLDFTLVPQDALKEVVRVLMYGAGKYGKWNWDLVPREEYIKAAFRHMHDILTWNEDDESGFHHAAHAICCLLFILEKDIEDLEDLKGLSYITNTTRPPIQLELFDECCSETEFPEEPEDPNLYVGSYAGPVL